MMMKCIVIDDEPLALTQMSKYIGKTTFLDAIKFFSGPKEALRWLSENEVDLIFVDINMPGMNGIEFVNSLQKKTLVIFTTAYSEYALEGFRVDALDYLLKPIGYPDFLRATEKAYKLFQLLGGTLSQQETEKIIFIKSDYKVIPINLDDILYIESQSEYVRIYLESDRPLMSLGSLKSYEQKLPPDLFMRIHRSYIINLHRIASVERKQVVLKNGISIPIGDLYEEAFKTYITQRLHK